MVKKVAVIIVLFFLLMPFFVRAPVYSDEGLIYGGLAYINIDRALWYVNNPAVVYNTINNHVSLKIEYLKSGWQVFANEADSRNRNSVVVSAAIIIEALLAIIFIFWINPVFWFRSFFLRWFKANKQAGERSWGVVYDSLSKLPIDLANVRLVQAASGQIVQTKVTDNQGRFIFIVGPGEYRVEVYKPKFVFPSQLFLKIQQDGHKADLYHGNIIKISDGNGVIALNIPIDASGEHAKPVSYWVQSVSDNFRLIISWFSFLLASLIYIIFLEQIFLVLFEVQGVLFILLWLSLGSKKLKRWGTVYDLSNRKSIKGVAVSLFNTQFNKHVISQTTDQRGRYYFVVGDGDYYLTFKHPGFVEDRLDLPSLRDGSAKGLMVDKGLEKTLFRHPGGLGKIKEQEEKRKGKSLY